MKNKPFSLPPDVNFSKEPLPQGGLSYVFRHKTLGKLGRLLVLPHGGQSHITCEVAGDADDPMTAKRLEVLRPIATALTCALENAYGAGQPAPPPRMQEPKEFIPSKVLVCLTCDAPVALLVFSSEAYSPDKLEDTARLMYPRISDMALPTWIIGEEEGVTGDTGKAWTMKAWPVREAACQMLSTELNPIFDKLQNNHCQ